MDNILVGAYVLCTILIMVIAVVMVGICIFSFLQAINEWLGNRKGW
jgi:hypothetical protein